MIRFTILALFLLIFGTGLHAQWSKEQTNSPQAFSKKLSGDEVKFEAGTSVGVSSDRSFFLQNYFSPSKSFQLNKKLTLVAGVGLVNTQVNNLPVLNTENTLSTTNLNFTSAYTYARGIYQLNPKVYLNTQVAYEHLFITSAELPGTQQTNFKELSFGLNYRPSKNFSFNAGFQFSDRPFNPFRYGYGSPFGSYPFSTF
jgi:long-subunit fatty acid transport protein